MRMKFDGKMLKVWASADDTQQWAQRPGAKWPCSTLSGYRFFAEFDNGDLVDLSVEGGKDIEFDAHEFNAFLSDCVWSKIE